MPSTLSSRKKLAELAVRWQQRSLRDEFQSDKDRFSRFSIKIGGLFTDFSKNHVDDETLSALFELAEEAGFTDWRQRMFAGEAINNTENRAAWHVALRDTNLLTDVLRKQIDGERQREAKLVQDIRASSQFTDVVNIGIGGSHLGPELVCKALSSHQSAKIKPHFLSHTDPRGRTAILKKLDPQKTLVLVASKSFSTAETSVNTRAVIDWLTDDGANSQRVKEQVIAISANEKAVKEMGITQDNYFVVHDWVGGRYSMWSSIGLPIAIAFGYDALTTLRNGAKLVDDNFLQGEARNNLALVLGLLDVWYASFMACSSRAILPYNAALDLLPNYLQQLVMESGGKGVQRDGKNTDLNTAPIVWGGMGQSGQHAYYQLLHQGTQIVPAEFIFAIDKAVADDPGYEVLAANFVAQSEALMHGMSADEAMRENEDEELIKHRVFPGNRPSTSILLDQLDAYHLGQLIALYEHRTFVQAVCWNTNPFDQMGVELGKRLSGNVGKLLRGETAGAHDSSTIGLSTLLAKSFRRD